MKGRRKLPESEKKVTVSITLTPKLWQEAKEHWYNVSAVVERLLKKELEKEKSNK